MHIQDIITIVVANVYPIVQSTTVTTEIDEATSDSVLVVRSVCEGHTVRHQFRVTAPDQLNTWHQAFLQSKLDVGQ